MRIYLVGSLRNPKIPEVANELRAHGHEVFDDWFAGGPEADDCWQKYCQGRGQTHGEALLDKMAQHIFLFDKHYLDQSDVGVLLAPAGKSAYLELGYLTGQGKPTFIVQEKDPERWDVMAAFACVCESVSKVAQKLELIKA